MATPRETPASAPVEMGTFVSEIAIGYVAPTPAEIRQIDAALRAQPTSVVQTDAFLRNLLVIKLLAPEASRELLIYPAPMVLQFVDDLRRQLQQQYYLSTLGEPR